MHPLLYHCVLCWGDLFSLDHVCGYQYALLKGQCVYGFYSFVGAEQVRPLHTPYLKSGSQDGVRPLQAPHIISLCALLGWSFLIRSCLWVSICSPKGSVCLWFVLFCLDRTSETTAHTLLEIWVTGWSETTTSTSCHITLCFVGGDLFSLDYICGYQYELLQGQCAYGLYRFARTEQVRPLHASYLKTRSLAEMRPLHTFLVISLCAFLGWSILIRSCLWVSICAPKGSVFLWFVQFWRGWSETTAHTLLEIWVTGWSETTTSTPYHITLCFVGGDLFSLDYICGYQYELIKGQFVYGLNNFAWTEQVRPLQASYLKTGSLTEVRPLQASLIISPCALLGDVFSLDHLCGYRITPHKSTKWYD